MCIFGVSCTVAIKCVDVGLFKLIRNIFFEYFVTFLVSVHCRLYAYILEEYFQSEK